MKAKKHLLLKYTLFISSFCFPFLIAKTGMATELTSNPLSASETIETMFSEHHHENDVIEEPPVETYKLESTMNYVQHPMILSAQTYDLNIDGNWHRLKAENSGYPEDANGYHMRMYYRVTDYNPLKSQATIQLQQEAWADYGLLNYYTSCAKVYVDGQSHSLWHFPRQYGYRHDDGSYTNGYSWSDGHHDKRYHTMTITGYGKHTIKTVDYKMAGNTQVQSEFVTTINIPEPKYTNTIYHWKNVGTGGDNASGTHKLVGSTSFTGTYNKSTTIPNHAKTIKGYHCTNTLGSGSFGPSWKTFNVGDRYTQPAGSVVFETYYNPNTYTVTYQGNGGVWNGKTSWQNKATYDRNYKIENGFFSKPGYEFVGWKGSDGKDWKPGSTWKWAYDSNVTLTAQWKPKTYTVTYQGNGGVWNGKTSWQNQATYNQNYKIENGFFTKSGCEFLGWKGSDGKNWKPGSTWKWTYDFNVTLTAQWNNKPVVTKADFYWPKGKPLDNALLKEGKVYVPKQSGITNVTWKDLKYGDSKITVKDVEDGDLSNKVQIKTIKAPDGTTESQINTNKTGKHTVSYTVKDSHGCVVEFTRNVIVMEAPTPIVNGSDQWYYVGDAVSRKDVLEKVEAHDDFDGDISSQIEIPNLNNIKTNKVGDYEITLNIKNSFGKTATITITVHIVDFAGDTEGKGLQTIRFISDDCGTTSGKDYCLPYLKNNSKWIQDTQLKNQLKTSLSKTDESEAIKTYNFSNKDIKQMKRNK